MVKSNKTNQECGGNEQFIDDWSENLCSHNGNQHTG